MEPGAAGGPNPSAQGWWREAVTQPVWTWPGSHGGWEVYVTPVTVLGTRAGRAPPPKLPPEWGREVSAGPGPALSWVPGEPAPPDRRRPLRSIALGLPKSGPASLCRVLGPKSKAVGGPGPSRKRLPGIPADSSPASHLQPACFRPAPPPLRVSPAAAPGTGAHPAQQLSGAQPSAAGQCFLGLAGLEGAVPGVGDRWHGAARAGPVKRALLAPRSGRARSEVGTFRTRALALRSKVPGLARPWFP